MLKVLNRDNGLPTSAASIRNDIIAEVIYIYIYDYLNKFNSLA